MTTWSTDIDHYVDDHIDRARIRNRSKMPLPLPTIFTRSNIVLPGTVRNSLFVKHLEVPKELIWSESAFS